MTDRELYLVAADAILIVHALFVAFVVVGLLLIIVGGFRNWGWVRGFRFRILHLAAIGLVVLQAWMGAICPLTLWEMQLRELGGDLTYSGGFIAYWLHRLLYFRAPPIVFAVAYTLFAALVAASWFWVRPRRN